MGSLPNHPRRWCLEPPSIKTIKQLWDYSLYCRRYLQATTKKGLSGTSTSMAAPASSTSSASSEPLSPRRPSHHQHYRKSSTMSSSATRQSGNLKTTTSSARATAGLTSPRPCSPTPATPLLVSQFWNRCWTSRSSIRRVPFFSHSLA